MDFCDYKKKHSMAAIINTKIRNRTRERGGDKREKDYKNLHKSLPHPLFLFFFYLFKLNFVC